MADLRKELERALEGVSSVRRQGSSLRELRKLCDDLCLLEDDELNVWEAKFVSDVSNMVHKGVPPSTKQELILKRLWARECGP